MRRTLLRPAEWLISNYSRDGRRTFFDTEDFPWIKGIEARAPEIRRELEQLLLRRDSIPNVQDIQGKQKYLTTGADWKTFVLYAYGGQVEENCRRCPNTARILKQIPGMKSALFSILAPGKHIPRHGGVYKGVLRYHLGLIVPQPETLCRIQVGPDVRSWGEGRSLVFDDRHPHEVWNDSTEYRTVLLVDFVRPLPLPIDLLNRAVIQIFSMTSFATDSVKRARDAAKDTELSAANDSVMKEP
jgi:beta-hydroxylase